MSERETGRVAAATVEGAALVRTPPKWGGDPTVLAQIADTVPWCLQPAKRPLVCTQVAKASAVEGLGFSAGEIYVPYSH